MPAADALRLSGLSVQVLEGRDALALANGTSFLTAFAALAVARAERLVARAEMLTGWMYRLLHARPDALDDRLHTRRGHGGQIESARRIRQEAFAGGAWAVSDGRALQEVYSLRCAPQILGACRDNLASARATVETEMNGVSDNPLIFWDEAGGPVALHGGNFQGQQVAFAADMLGAALTQTAILAERQLDAIVTPSPTNENAPLLLAWEPGATSGLAGVQITATALVAEMRSLTHAHATYSQPTNGNNQDVVSMGTLAARRAFALTDHLAAVHAALSLGLSQLTFLREQGRASGPVCPLPAWMPHWEPLTDDRPLHDTLQQIADAWLF